MEVILPCGDFFQVGIFRVGIFHVGNNVGGDIIVLNSYEVLFGHRTKYSFDALYYQCEYLELSYSLFMNSQCYPYSAAVRTLSTVLLSTLSEKKGSSMVLQNGQRFYLEPFAI